MKYYSEKLQSLYESEQELVKAEKAYDKKIADEKAKKEKAESERAVRAKEVEEAYKVMKEAQKVYSSKLSAFTKDYGSFHMTLHDEDSDWLSFDDFWDILLRR